MSWRSVFVDIIQDVRVLPRYRALLGNLLMRDMHVKYRSSVLGYFWSLLNPLLSITIYTFAFKYLLQIRASGKTSFISLLVVSIIFWGFISQCIQMSTVSLLEDASLLRTVRFPRIISVLSRQLFLFGEHLLIYPFLALFLFLGMGVPVGTNLLWLIPILVLVNVFLLGIGAFLATAMVFYRDVAHFIGIGLQVLFWLTPVVYSIEAIPQEWVCFIQAMPFSPIMVCFQDVLCRGMAPPLRGMFQAIMYALISFVVGLLVFYRYHRRFAQEI